jgi:ketosteroid isomerase-like protein
MQLELADRVAILDLYASYAHAFDTGDAATWADHFVPDGRFIYNNEAPIVGRSALQEFFARRHADAPGIRHFMANCLVEVTPDGVRGRVSALVLRIAGDGALRVRTIGGYKDALVHGDGGWRFLERHFEPWLPDELADAALEFAVGVDAM